MNRIKRLTTALENVITSLLGGRNYPIEGDSKAPFDDNITSSTHVQYNTRYGWHLRNYEEPQKSVGEKDSNIKGI
tara:strand:- start:108 stop:332 length:225 start_codon:yes stop_codon:yes gene_type:complete